MTTDDASGLTTQATRAAAGGSDGVSRSESSTSNQRRWRTL